MGATMLRRSHRSNLKTIPLAIILICILLIVLLLTPAQASVTKETSFSAEVVLNKPGVTYDLTPLEAYAKEGSAKVVDEDGNYVKYDQGGPDKASDNEDPETESKYYFYKSHYDPKLVVTLYEVQKTIYYPSGEDFDEAMMEGLGMKLSIPTEYDEKKTDYEKITLTLDAQMNITEGFFKYMDQLGFKIVDFKEEDAQVVFMEFTRGGVDKDEDEKNDDYEKEGEYEKDDDYEKDDEHEKDGVYLSFSLSDGGKSSEVPSQSNEMTITVKGQKGFSTDTFDNDIRDILLFLSIDPDKWDEGQWEELTETEKDYVPAEKLYPEDLDWSAAMEKELEWLKSESIISGLTADDIQAISDKSMVEDPVVYENGEWMSFSETDALPTVEEAISISSLIDWSILPANPPGQSFHTGSDVIYDLDLVIGLMVILIIVVVAFSSYTRIRRRSILENINRRRIYERIKEKPGIHFSALLKDLGIKSGTLSHHINILENEEYVKSRQSGMFRRFFLHEEKALLTFNLSTIQEKILKVIMDHPGITQAGISKKIDSNKMKVNYHVKLMRDAKLLTLEKKGRESLCFITGAGMTFLPE